MSDSGLWIILCCSENCHAGSRGQKLAWIDCLQMDALDSGRFILWLMGMPSCLYAGSCSSSKVWCCQTENALLSVLLLYILMFMLRCPPGTVLSSEKLCFSFTSAG